MRLSVRSTELQFVDLSSGDFLTYLQSSIAGVQDKLPKEWYVAAVHVMYNVPQIVNDSNIQLPSDDSEDLKVERSLAELDALVRRIGNPHACPLFDCCAWPGQLTSAVAIAMAAYHNRKSIGPEILAGGLQVAAKQLLTLPLHPDRLVRLLPDDHNLATVAPVGGGWYMYDAATILRLDARYRNSPEILRGQDALPSLPPTLVDWSIHNDWKFSPASSVVDGFHLLSQNHPTELQLDDLLRQPDGSFGLSKCPFGQAALSLFLATDVSGIPAIVRGLDLSSPVASATVQRLTYRCRTYGRHLHSSLWLAYMPLPIRYWKEQLLAKIRYLFQYYRIVIALGEQVKPSSGAEEILHAVAQLSQRCETRVFDISLQSWQEIRQSYKNGKMRNCVVRSHMDGFRCKYEKKAFSDMAHFWPSSFTNSAFTVTVSGPASSMQRDCCKPRMLFSLSHPTSCLQHCDRPRFSIPSEMIHNFSITKLNRRAKHPRGVSRQQNKMDHGGKLLRFTQQPPLHSSLLTNKAATAVPSVAPSSQAAATDVSHVLRSSNCKRSAPADGEAEEVLEPVLPQRVDELVSPITSFVPGLKCRRTRSSFDFTVAVGATPTIAGHAAMPAEDDFAADSFCTFDVNQFLALPEL